jgi:inner membrane protein involved in colicin E2 resistance
MLSKQQGDILKELAIIFIIVSMITVSNPNLTCFSWRAYYVADFTCWCIVAFYLIWTLEGRRRLTAISLFMFTVNAFVDFIFFNSTKLEWNEVVFGSLIVGWSIISQVTYTRKHGHR